MPDGRFDAQRADIAKCPHVLTRCRTPLRQEHNPFGNQELGSSGFWG